MVQVMLEQLTRAARPLLCAWIESSRISATRTGPANVLPKTWKRTVIELPLRGAPPTNTRSERVPGCVPTISIVGQTTGIDRVWPPEGEGERNNVGECAVDIVVVGFFSTEVDINSEVEMDK